MTAEDKAMLLDMQLNNCTTHIEQLKLIIALQDKLVSEQRDLIVMLKKALRPIHLSTYERQGLAD